MRATLHQVSKGRHGEILAPTSCILESGKITVVGSDTDQGPSVLSLILAGRMRVNHGSIHLEGGHSRRRLRRVAALIDTPAVCEPAPTVRLRNVVSEELLFARRLSTPLAAQRWLDEHGFEEYAGRPMMNVPAMARLKVLTELALERPGIELIVWTTPERHGADLHEMLEYAKSVADRGYALAMVCGTTTERLALAALSHANAHPKHLAELAAAPSPSSEAGSPSFEQLVYEPFAPNDSEESAPETPTTTNAPEEHTA